MLCLYILIFLLLTICFFVLWVELQSSIIIILNKGGLWLQISFGINRFRMISIRIRLMHGHKPRVWIRNLITGKYSPLDVLKATYKKLSRRIDISFNSIIKLGLKIIIRKLEVKARIGVEDDAAATAMLCGFFVAFFETIRTIGTHGQFISKGFIIVNPIFGHDCLLFMINCMIGLKVKDIAGDMIKNRAIRK